MAQTQTTPTLKCKGLLFGLNYAHTTTARLNGCVNDVHNMATYLSSALNMPCDIYTDDTDLVNTSGMGILQKLYELAVATYKDDLDFVWIHYSGHGSYIKDTSGDEADGKDECLVPSDFQKKGLLLDDQINRLFANFNPKTRVLFVFDCCHSGTIGDVKYSWEGPSKVAVENIKCKAAARVITISGCLDTEVSMDAYNVAGDNKFSGAMTSCMLAVLRENEDNKNNAFVMLDKLREMLIKKQFVQKPKLCSSHNLALDPVLVPTPK
jgi:metacaspase-1